MSLPDAATISAQVRSRERSAVEIAQGALADIEDRDREINAFTFVLHERALADARRVDAQIAAGQDQDRTPASRSPSRTSSTSRARPRAPAPRSAPMTHQRPATPLCSRRSEMPALCWSGSWPWMSTPTASSPTTRTSAPAVTRTTPLAPPVAPRAGRVRRWPRLRSVRGRLRYEWLGPRPGRAVRGLRLEADVRCAVVSRHVPALTNA